MSRPKALEVIVRGCSEIINVQGLEEKLKKSEQTRVPLKVKAGFDPTAPDLHLGHVVLLRKLRQFQDLGHQVIFLIGDFTAQVGDPTGRDQTRPRMTSEEIAENAKTYKKQVFKILDKNKTQVVFNSQWLSNLGAQEILKLTACSSVAQMLARADFKERFESNKEISLLEFIYPLLQAYDSVHLQSDIEMGGSDQKFNLLMGRQLQEVFRQTPQVVMMTPLLEGTDGVRKMSKSYGNYIGINEPAQEIYGKIMSISDELMYRYFEVLTSRDLAAVKGLHPKEAKSQLAQEVTAFLHDGQQAQKARDEFDKVFGSGAVPEDIKEYRLGQDGQDKILDILIKMDMAPSKKEIRRLFSQGAITWESQKIESEDWVVKQGVIKIGKRRFLKLV